MKNRLSRFAVALLVFGLLALPARAAVNMLSGPTSTITAATAATPIVATTSAAHNYVTGDVVRIAGVLGNVAANGSWIVTNLTATTFSLDGSVGTLAYDSGGTSTLLGARATGAGAWFETGSGVVFVQVYGSSAATATVQIQVSSALTGSKVNPPAYTVATVTNPTTSGEHWSIPRTGRVRCNVSAWTSGTVYCLFETFR